MTKKKREKAVNVRELDEKMFETEFGRFIFQCDAETLQANITN